MLLGSNGAGKSTTIKSIIGLLRYEGQIAIFGYDNLSVEAEKCFGYIPETLVLYNLLSVQEHIDFIGKAYEIPDYQDIADHYLDLFQIPDKKKTIA